MIDLFRNGQGLQADRDFTYEEAREYVSMLYSVSFESIMSAEEFEAARNRMSEMDSLYVDGFRLPSGNGDAAGQPSGTGMQLGCNPGTWLEPGCLPCIWMYSEQLKKWGSLPSQ